MTAMLEAPTALDAAGGLAHALAVVRHRTGLDILLDAGDGEVLDYAVTGSVPAPVVRAILTKDLSPVQAAATSPRTVAVVPSGPVIAWQVGPRLRAVAIPVCAASRACVWLFGQDVDMDARAAQDVAELVAAGLPDLQQTHDLEAILAGRAPLPSEWAGQPLTVAVVHTGRPHVALAALRAAGHTCDLPMLVGVSGGAVVAVVAGSDPGWLRAAREDIVQHDGSARGAYCEAGPGVMPLPRMHAVAQAAASVSPCPVESARTLASRVAVEHAGVALVTAPVDPDVVSLLMRHDAERGTDLARTLLTWLELHGDVTAAAHALTVHVNTLRYRLRRASALLGSDLADPDVRLDVHLRLRRVLPNGRTPRS